MEECSDLLTLISVWTIADLGVQTKLRVSDLCPGIGESVGPGGNRGRSLRSPHCGVLTGVTCGQHRAYFRKRHKYHFPPA